MCDLETSRICAPYIYNIRSLRVNDLTIILLTWRKWWANNASKQQMGFNSGFKGLNPYFCPFCFFPQAHNRNTSSWNCTLKSFMKCYRTTPMTLCIHKQDRKINFDVLLTVPLSITLANDQLDAQIFNTFIAILYMYMFRAISCSSSGGQIVLIQHPVSSLLTDRHAAILRNIWRTSPSPSTISIDIRSFTRQRRHSSI